MKTAPSRPLGDTRARHSCCGLQLLLACLLALTATACSDLLPPSVPGLEDSQSRGHGYWILTIAKAQEHGFEAIGHFNHCYYQARDLGQCDKLFPSANGDYAVYQDGMSGRVMFFNARTGQSLPLTSSFPGLLATATWQEAQQKIEIGVGESTARTTFTFSYGGFVSPPDGVF